MAALPPEERLILPALQAVQRSFGYIADDWLDTVADFLNVSRAEVVGVFSYYHDLRSQPPAAVVVELCKAEACQAVGARALATEAERGFAAAVDVELRTVYCLGNCALGPAATVNGRLLGRCDITRLAAAVAEVSR